MFNTTFTTKKKEDKILRLLERRKQRTSSSRLPHISSCANHFVHQKQLRCNHWPATQSSIKMASTKTHNFIKKLAGCFQTLPWVDKLAFHWVVVEDTSELWVNWFTILKVQSHYVSFVMLTLHRRITVSNQIFVCFRNWFRFEEEDNRWMHTVREMITSWVSRPAFSASVLGTTRRALAKASTPSWARCKVDDGDIQKIWKY